MQIFFWSVQFFQNKQFRMLPPETLKERLSSAVGPNFRLHHTATPKKDPLFLSTTSFLTTTTLT